MNEEQIDMKELSERIRTTKELKDQINSFYQMGDNKFRIDADIAFCLMMLAIPDEINLVRKLLGVLTGERFYVMVNVDDVNNFPQFEELKAELQKINPNAFVFLCSNNSRDFAEMRNRFLDNESIKPIIKAKWLYFIDADEMIERFQLDGLRRILKENDNCEIASIWNVAVSKDAESHCIQQIRLIKKTSKVRWVSSCHETLNIDAARKGVPTLATDVIMHHRGYLKDMDMYVAKLERNLESLSYGIVQMYEQARVTGAIDNQVYFNYVGHIQRTAKDLMLLKESAENGVKK